MSKTMLKGIHRRAVGISADNELMAPDGFVVGGDGQPAIVSSGPNTVAVFDDFTESPVLQGVNDTGVGTVGTVNHHRGLYFRWIGTDTGNDVKLQDTGGVNGIIRIGPVNDGTQTPAGTNTSLVGRAANWKANMGPGPNSGRLRFGARLTCPGNADSVWNVGSVFAGFADTGALGAGTMPIYDTGASDTGGIAAVSNAVGFLFGENAPVGIRGVSAKGGAAGRQTVTLLSSEPVVNKFYNWELELTRGQSDTGGKVNFYIDGVIKGSINSPVTTNEPLVPGIWVMASDTGAPSIDVDWIAVSGPRDTGR